MFRYSVFRSVGCMVGYSLHFISSLLNHRLVIQLRRVEADSCSRGRGRAPERPPRCMPVIVATVAGGCVVVEPQRNYARLNHRSAVVTAAPVGANCGRSNSSTASAIGLFITAHRPRLEAGNVRQLFTVRLIESASPLGPIWLDARHITTCSTCPCLGVIVEVADVLGLSIPYVVRLSCGNHAHLNSRIIGA